jgi:hypothetical protein
MLGRFKSFLNVVTMAAVLSTHPHAGASDELSGHSDAEDLSTWQHKDGRRPIAWTVKNDYVEIVPGTGDIQTVTEYQDFRLHLEFWLPYEPDHQGQARANSGIYLQGLYELQILDSSDTPELTSQVCGALYKQVPPLVKACKGPLTWQTYDVDFRAPRVDQNNQVITAGELTAWLNGELILDKVPITKPTGAAGRDIQRGVGPIRLQDHGSLVRFRNVVIIPRH